MLASTLTRWRLLNDHRILVTGVLTEDSLAFGIAKRALEEGATVALSGAGRGLSLTKRTARKLGDVGRDRRTRRHRPQRRSTPPRPN